ncbi:hypothetical protein T484DRAFT_3431940 [Baffinella frigidus]|nr:hypothetical protein T484DRAFT_3431940 [Cryptophyta sp. CCMP2293]
MEDGAAKVAALRAKRDAWMSQRSAAMERENMRSEDGGLVALGGGAGDGGAVNDDLVLDRITEQITSRLREELRIEVQREEQVASRQRAKEGEEIGGYLASELESTTCPICYELMQAPQHTPTLLFPCGHTFCIECVTAHIKANHRHTCPYCRVKIEKQAPNMLLQQLIDGFAQKKASTTQKAAAAAARPPAAVAQMALAVERPDVGRILADCPGEARGQIEDYIRQWRALQMRWRIYDNEAADCKRDEANIRAKRSPPAQNMHMHITYKI